MLTRQDIIQRMRDRGHTKSASEEYLDELVHIITEALVEGEEVQIHGFGTFSVSDRAPRKSVHVRTGEEIMLPAYRAVKFTVGGTLNRAVKEGILRD